MPMCCIEKPSRSIETAASVRQRPTLRTAVCTCWRDGPCRCLGVSAHSCDSITMCSYRNGFIHAQSVGHGQQVGLQLVQLSPLVLNAQRQGHCWVCQRLWNVEGEALGVSHRVPRCENGAPHGMHWHHTW